jgi:hypothetical protein
MLLSGAMRRSEERQGIWGTGSRRSTLPQFPGKSPLSAREPRDSEASRRGEHQPGVPCASTRDSESAERGTNVLLLLVRCRRPFSSWSGAGAPSPPGDGFERRLGLGLRAAARVSTARREMGGRSSGGRRSGISPKCQLCVAHFVLYAPRIFDT